MLQHNMVWCWNVLGRVTKQNPTLPQPTVPAGSPCDRCTAKASRPIRDKLPTRVVSQGGSSTRVRAPSLTDLGMQDLAFIWCLVYLKQIQATWTKFEKRWSQVEFITQQIGNNLYYKYPQWASGQTFLQSFPFEPKTVLWFELIITMIAWIFNTFT